MARDAQGHDMTGATPEAAELFDKAVRAFTLSYGDTVGLFEAARKAAPGFAMAHIGKAWVLASANDAVLVKGARPLMDQAKSLPLNDRERSHLAALEHAVRGHRSSILAVLDPHLMHYPRDLLAHFAAMIASAFNGQFHTVRDRSARALARWSPSDPTTASCCRSTVSVLRRPAITRSPRPSRARLPSSNPTATGRITRSAT
jgi:hypothetical protein